MQGLWNVLPHLLTVGLLWISSLVILELFKRAVVKGIETKFSAAESPPDRSGDIMKVHRRVSVLHFSFHFFFVSVIILIFLFLYNPGVRTHEALKGIVPATHDERYEPPAKEEIESLNQNHHDHRKSEVLQNEAQRDNTNAMETSIALFRNTKATQNEPVKQ